MKFIISRNEFFSRLQVVNKVIPSKSTYPMLDNFKLVLEGDQLTITGTDLETTMISKLTVDNAEGEGSLAIDAKRLLDILKEFPEQPLIFEVNDETKNVDIVTQTGKYSIGAQPADEYPEPPAIDENQAYTFTISSEALNRGISKTYFSTSNDDLQIIMTGIYIELKPENITFVATDAHKLVRYRRSDFGADMENSFILPKKPADLLRNILSKADDMVKVVFNDRNAIFELPEFKIVSRLIEGQYPNYESVIPSENPNTLTIDRLEFYNAIKRVSVFANEASKLVKFTIDNNQVTISAQDIDFSISAEEHLPCNYDGEPMKIGFKSNFILEILQNIDSPDVVMKMSDSSRASLLLPSETEDENEDVLMLLMPMMLDEF